MPINNKNVYWLSSQNALAAQDYQQNISRTVMSTVIASSATLSALDTVYVCQLTVSQVTLPVYTSNAQVRVIKADGSATTGVHDLTINANVDDTICSAGNSQFIIDVKNAGVTLKCDPNTAGRWIPVEF